MVGVWAKGVESAQSFGFLVLFPMSFISKCAGADRRDARLVAHPRRLEPRQRGDSNVATLWGNPNPSALDGVWPMQHPVLVAVAWSLLLLSVCVPLASFLHRHRTTT